MLITLFVFIYSFSVCIVYELHIQVLVGLVLVGLVLVGLVLVIFCFSSYSVSGVGDEPGAVAIATSSSIVAAVWRTSGGGDDGIVGGDDTGD